MNRHQLRHKVDRDLAAVQKKLDQKQQGCCESQKVVVVEEDLLSPISNSNTTSNNNNDVDENEDEENQSRSHPSIDNHTVSRFEEANEQLGLSQCVAVLSHDDDNKSSSIPTEESNEPRLFVGLKLKEEDDGRLPLQPVTHNQRLSTLFELNDLPSSPPIPPPGRSCDVIRHGVGGGSGIPIPLSPESVTASIHNYYDDGQLNTSEMQYDTNPQQQSAVQIYLSEPLRSSSSSSSSSPVGLGQSITTLQPTLRTSFETRISSLSLPPSKVEEEEAAPLIDNTTTTTTTTATASAVHTMDDGNGLEDYLRSPSLSLRAQKGDKVREISAVFESKSKVLLSTASSPPPAIVHTPTPAAPTTTTVTNTVGIIEGSGVDYDGVATSSPPITGCLTHQPTPPPPSHQQPPPRLSQSQDRVRKLASLFEIDSVILSPSSTTSEYNRLSLT